MPISAFECKQCGNCCRRGFVFLAKGEAGKIAARLNISEKDFKRRFTRHILLAGRALKWGKEGCVFLKGNGCSVYPVRPSQCSTWPYWKDIDIEKAVKYCKGIKPEA